MHLIPDYVWATLTIWMEARGESYAGMVAVAEVIYRRTQRKYFSDGTVAGTVLRDRQFSGWNNSDPNRVKAAVLDSEDRVVKLCARAWQEAIAGSDMTKGALHYYNPAVCDPEWAKGMTVVARVGKHAFLKEDP